MLNNTENDKTYVLITGASSGIGRQCAIQLSESYNLLLCARREEKLNETKALCKNPKNHLVFPVDLSDTENIENQLTSFIKENNICIEKFLHSAGTIGMMPLKMVSNDFIINCLKVNLISAELIVKVLSNKKINLGRLNSVVFISSNISNMGAKAFSVYSASKSGLDGMMKSLAMELAPKVRVNSVLPGGVETEMTQSIYADEEKIKRIEETYPLGLGSTKNIADAVEFLFSDNASWITGQQLAVDGGRCVNITG